jgi:hypothetical protein
MNHFNPLAERTILSKIIIDISPPGKANQLPVGAGRHSVRFSPNFSVHLRSSVYSVSNPLDHYIIRENS